MTENEIEYKNVYEHNDGNRSRGKWNLPKMYRGQKTIDGKLYVTKAFDTPRKAAVALDKLMLRSDKPMVNNIFKRKI